MLQLWLKIYNQVRGERGVKHLTRRRVLNNDVDTVIGATLVFVFFLATMARSPRGKESTMFAQPSS